MLLVVFLEHFVFAVLLLAILSRFPLRRIRCERNPLAVPRPVKILDVRLRLCQLPGFAAFRRDEPDLMRRGLPSVLALFLLLLFVLILGLLRFLFLLFTRARFNRGRLALADECQPVPVRRPLFLAG